MDRSAKKEIKRNLVSRDCLIKDLKNVIDNFDCMDSGLLKSKQKLLNIFFKILFLILEILSEDYKFFEDTITAIKKTSRSDIIISFGNNNKISKVFINDIIAKNELSSNYKQINFNSFIHSTEDIILKKICNTLRIDLDKSGFDGYRKAIEDYYKGIAERKSNVTRKRKENEEVFLVIFFDNMDQLFIKKKQILIYTLLEIVNISSNLLFCGTSACSNLIDSMEKRNRSRFSQKTSFIRIKDKFSFYQSFSNMFLSHLSISMDEDSNSSLQTFYEILMTCCDTSGRRNSKNEEKFVALIDNYINLGKSIQEILTKIKYLLSIITLKIFKYEEDGVIITKEKLYEIILDELTDFENEEISGSFFNLLKSKNIHLSLLLDFPKLHVTLLICLIRCVSKYKLKISIGMIYQEYSDFVCPKFHHNSYSRAKLDMIVVKKALEELANSNLITICNDDRLINTYEIKQPIEVIQKLIFKLDDMKIGNIDSELSAFLNVNFK